MVTYEAMNMLFQFGIFLATGLTALMAIIALVTKGANGSDPHRVNVLKYTSWMVKYYKIYIGRVSH